MEVLPTKAYIQYNGATEYKYVIIKVSGSSQYVLGQAPVTGISIQQHIDYNIVKTMSGNFGMITFQDHPVAITISGLRMMLTNCTAEGMTGDITQLYEKYRGAIGVGSGDVVNKFIEITVGKQTFYGIIVGLTQRTATGDFPGLVQYALSIYGVRMPTSV